jgi:chromosome segregation ATPase
LRALKEHFGATSEAVSRKVDELCTDLQRLGQTIGRLERERLDAQKTLKNEVNQLRQGTQQLSEELARTQGALQMLLAEANQSTVGSAGLSWAW